MSQVDLPPTPAETSEPDWVIVGYRQREKYVVLGSIEVSHARLTALIGVEEDPDHANVQAFPRRLATYKGTEVAAVMRRYVRAEGYSYAEALAILMATWNAEGHGPALPPG